MPLPLLVPIIAAVAPSLIKGGFDFFTGMKAADEQQKQVDEANRIGLETWGKEFGLQKDQFAQSKYQFGEQMDQSKRKEAVDNYNKLLEGNQALQSKMASIFAGRAL